MILPEEIELEEEILKENDFAKYENIEEINMIIKTVKSRNKLEGKDYTNGNLNRLI